MVVWSTGKTPGRQQLKMDTSSEGAIPIKTCATPPTAPANKSFNVLLSPELASSSASAMLAGFESLSYFATLLVHSNR